ncbi:MAG: adenosylmethionine-8-amino-7-oxononanoate aminotransferase [Sphingobacteriales bacterium]|jgi:adenosylmethionine-8-amino-7-oxononanoate aminotransferase
MKKSLGQRDLDVIWHPYSQMKNLPQPVAITSGKGTLLFDEDGNAIIDAISSWWVNIHGHSHPHIQSVISEQLGTLEHVIFAGFTHKPAVELSERLLEILPSNQKKTFYSDNGSTAVEVAIKMTFQFWKNKNSKRNKLIAFKGSYHGDTFGAMSVSERGAFTKPFWPYLFDITFIEPPTPGNEETSINELNSALAGKDTAGFIYEPLIQGASGMIMHSPEALSALLEICKKNGVICIADEVMTGFGRTGALFASEFLSEEPDIMCFSKGLTGGVLPMGMTSCTSEIFDSFLSDDKSKTLFHGHSFTGNPIGCAAGLASLDLLLTSESKTGREFISESHLKFIETELIPGEFPIKNVRKQGTIMAFEIATDESTSYFNKIRDNAYDYFLERGVLLRPLGNVIYILPPYCIKKAELQKIYGVIIAFLTSLKSN